MNVVLTGFMGSGKSTVGKILAEKLDLSFFDTDEILEENNSSTVSEIFAKYGEKTFRQMERETIKLVSGLDGVVISTGGGVPLNKDNISDLKKNAVIIYLYARPEEIYDRIKHTQNRPLIQKMLNPLGEIKKLLQERKSAYESCDFMVNTDGIAPLEVAQTILSNHEFQKLGFKER
ncbi:MAG: shikimate kinase [Elusimicrobia bacterium]|nr:shikimate kinase [Elusimicrobiota bacterium]